MAATIATGKLACSQAHRPRLRLSIRRLPLLRVLLAGP